MNSCPSLWTFMSGKETLQTTGGSLVPNPQLFPFSSVGASLSCHLAALLYPLFRTPQQFSPDLHAVTPPDLRTFSPLPPAAHVECNFLLFLHTVLFSSWFARFNLSVITDLPLFSGPSRGRFNSRVPDQNILIPNDIINDLLPPDPLSSSRFVNSAVK